VFFRDFYFFIWLAGDCPAVFVVLGEGVSGSCRDPRSLSLIFIYFIGLRFPLRILCILSSTRYCITLLSVALLPMVVRLGRSLVSVFHHKVVFRVLSRILLGIVGIFFSCF